MNIIILRCYPTHASKIYQQKFDNVKKRARTYVYAQNDRIKKICSEIDPNINKIRKIEDAETDIGVYQIILIDPNQQQLNNRKKQLLSLSLNQLNIKIQKYNKYVKDIDKYLNKIQRNKLKNN